MTAVVRVGPGRPSAWARGRPRGSVVPHAVMLAGMALAMVPGSGAAVRLSVAGVLVGTAMVVSARRRAAATDLLLDLWAMALAMVWCAAGSAAGPGAAASGSPASGHLHGTTALGEPVVMLAVLAAWALLRGRRLLRAGRGLPAAGLSAAGLLAMLLVG